MLRLLLLRDPYGGRTHDQPIADATPSPWPGGSRLLQELGLLACTLPHVASLRPTKKPRGQARTPEQPRPNQALHQRRRRIAHVNGSIKRWRSVQDRIRLWKQGGRALVMERCGALQNCRVRLTPWRPMV